MPQILMPYTVHLDHTLRVTPLNTLFAKGDSAAHRFELTIFRSGVQEDLTGCTVMRKFYRMADSTVVSVPGSVEDGKAVVVLDAACYDYIGRFALTITIQKGEEETTVFYGDGYMHGQNADTAISGEYIIYDINTLLEKIAEIDAATQAANTATENANTAASNANTATGKANTAASAANTAAANANAAKDSANAASAKINNMTVSATPVSTGTASAELSTVDGHYHLALGLPKGDTGATPQISVQVTTGAAGSEASVSVSGTAEEPVIHLTIPRGDTGAIENMTINGKPVESGTITLTAADLGAASAKEVSQLKSDKLDKTATAADSSKLGGKTLAEIMLALYPVGAVYISANSTSPASLFGGTWEQLKDRFLLGAGGSYAAGGTGGAATVSITPAGTNEGTAITAAQMPKHRHQVRIWDNAGTKGAAKTVSNYGADVVNATSGAQLPDGHLVWKTSSFEASQNGYGDPSGIADIAGNGKAHTHAFNGTTQSIATMPPYLAVYMWKRVS